MSQPYNLEENKKLLLDTGFELIDSRSDFDTYRYALPMEEGEYVVVALSPKTGGLETFTQIHPEESRVIASKSELLRYMMREAAHAAYAQGYRDGKFRKDTDV